MTSIAQPRFLGRLIAPDLRAVTARGAFVYAYLRSADGTPYYVGIAKAHRRPHAPHTTVVPKERHRVVILRSGLTWEQAQGWERRYIARYGRRDVGTGILRNMTDGGEGVLGMRHTAESRAKIAAGGVGRVFSEGARAKIGAASKGRIKTPETRAKLRDAQLGKTHTAEARAKIGAASSTRKKSPETRAKMSAAAKLRSTPEYRAKISATLKGHAVTEETRAKISASLRNAALSVAA